MNNDYLHELLDEVKSRDGGVMLNVAGKTEAVVLTIDRYNQLLVDKKHNPSKELKHSILVTGGAGYIGAHVVKQLVEANHKVIVLDNLSSGAKDNIDKKAVFIEGDIRNIELTKQVLKDHKIDVVVHLAASIEVEESVSMPVEYLHNNVIGTAALLQSMAECEVQNLIFSSTAAVYGQPKKVPIPENAELNPDNPYGSTKLICEQMIQYYSQYKGLNSVIFRYFNACGSDMESKIQSTHKSHLIPIIMEVVEGKRDFITIYGKDYDTFDGTCIRDYVHVMDIARAHTSVVNNLANLDNCNIYNIGTGKGQSVENIIQTTAELTGKMIPIEVAGRRKGDAIITVADNTKICQELNFKLKYSDIETIIKTSLSM